MSAFDAQFRSMEREFGNVDLADFFPGPIATMLQRTADSLNVPVAFMISVTVALTASFTPDVYVNGLGSMNEAHIFMLLELAPPGTNKSGACKLLQSTLRQVTFVLKAMHNDYKECQRIGVRVCEQSIPEEDKTATIAAGIRQQANRRNQLRVEDEYLGFQRMLNHGGGDGISFVLSAYNGESESNYVLSSGFFRSVIPRRNIFALCQPEVYMDKVASEQTGNGNGFISRLSLGVGIRNMHKTAELFELKDGEFTLVDMILALSAVSVVEHGSYAARDDESVLQIKSEFSDDSDSDPLAHSEEALLFYATHRFTTDVPRAAEAAEQLAVHGRQVRKAGEDSAEAISNQFQVPAHLHTTPGKGRSIPQHASSGSRSQ